MKRLEKKQAYKKVYKINPSLFKAGYADYLYANWDSKEAIVIAERAFTLYKELLETGKDYLAKYAELLKDYSFYLSENNQPFNVIAAIGLLKQQKNSRLNYPEHHCNLTVLIKLRFNK